MNIKNILICILVIVILILSGNIIYVQNKIIPEIKSDAVFENILSRKSVRNYDTTKEVSKPQIEKLLRAGMAAPSARNVQPWEFIVIQDKDKLKSIGDKINSAYMLKDASMAIAVLGNMDKASEMKIFWQQDTSAAVENILLEAEALGLGAVWIGVYPMDDRVQIIKGELDIPDNVIPLNIISIGYPKGTETPKDKWREDNIHFEHY